MSRKLFAFLLSELVTVRLVCKAPACGAVTEIPTRNLAGAAADPRCPACRTSFFGPATTNKNPLADLAAAVNALVATGVAGQIEFVVPDEGRPAGVV